MVSISGCQKDELPVIENNTAISSQFAGTWIPVKHQLEYWKLNENIVQRGTDTLLVYENDSINGKWAYYNGVPCDTVTLNSNGTWTLNNRRVKVPADANAGKDLRWSDTTITVAGAKTTTLIKSRYWEINDVASQGSSNYGTAYSYLRLKTKCTQTVVESGKADVVTRWTIPNKVFTILSLGSSGLVVGYHAQMSVSYRPGVLPTLPPQKTNRYVTNTITFTKQ